MSNKKAYFFDLDGTLLQSDHSIGGQTRSALLDLQKHAHVSLISARPLGSVLQIANDLGITGLMGALNGAIIADTEGHIHKSVTISEKSVLDIVTYFEPLPMISLNFYSGRHWIITQQNHNAAQEARILRIQPDFIYHGDDLNTFIHKNPIEKILLIHDMDDAQAQNLIDQWRIHHPDLNCAYSKQGYFEITSPAADKGIALRFIADYHQVPYGDTYAFGDGQVDIPLLIASGYAIAMENAIPAVKAVAHHIIGHHDADAIAQWVTAQHLVDVKTMSRNSS
jgi:Cof subfamily protein (haloacid dehalogenase superfamily)